MSPLVLLPIAFVVVLLAYAVVMQRRELRVLKREVVDHLRAHVVPAPADEAEAPEEWPPGVLDVGGPFSEAASHVSTGEWEVVLLVKAGCRSCRRVLAELPSVTEDLPLGYRIVVAAASFAGVGPIDGMATVQLQSADAVPTPALILVDPNGLIQGRGEASTAASVIAFIDEGLDHGYGPAMLVQERSGNSVHHAGHAPHAHA